MRTILVIAGLLAFFAFLGRDADTVSMRDVRESAAMKYATHEDKLDFARIVIGASGHACGQVVAVGAVEQVGTASRVLARCASGLHYVLGLSRTGPKVQAEDCRTSPSPACPTN